MQSNPFKDRLVKWLWMDVFICDVVFLNQQISLYVIHHHYNGNEEPRSKTTLKCHSPCLAFLLGKNNNSQDSAMTPALKSSWISCYVQNCLTCTGRAAFLAPCSISLVKVETHVIHKGLVCRKRPIRKGGGGARDGDRETYYFPEDLSYKM